MKVRRGIAVLVACALAATVVLTATQVWTNAAVEPSRDQLQLINFWNDRQLINFGSNKCFEPTPQYGHVEWAGLPVQQRTCRPWSLVSLQNWIFAALGFVIYNGEPPWYCPWCSPNGAEGYFIQNGQTDLCLDARDGSRSDWSVVQQWTCRDRNARSMVWYVEASDIPGRIRIKNFNSDLCLDVAWGSSAEYAQLQQYHCTSNNPAQAFYRGPVFRPVPPRW